MSKRVLFVAASPRAELSASRQIAGSFTQELRDVVRDIEIEELDLWESDLPELGPDAVSGRYSVFAGGDVDVHERQAWERVVSVTDQLKRADALVIATPMWNFSVPYRLKHWLDLVIQPRHTFSFDQDSGYSGLMAGKPAVLALSRAGEYPADTDSGDYHRTYLRLALGFIGFDPVFDVTLEPSYTGDPAADGARLESALNHARELAANVAGRMVQPAVAAS